MAPEEILGRLRQGEKEFLRRLPPEGKRLEEALRLGPGASYCLARHYESLGLSERADALFAQELRRGTHPWRDEAGLALAAGLLARERYGEAEDLLRTAKPGERAQRLLIEALYWQNKDRLVLELLESRRLAGAPWDAELDLFEAVARCRLAEPEWQEHFTRLFLRARASTLHTRAYGFLESRGGLADFAPALVALFGAKDLLYRGRAAEALERLEPVLAELPEDAFTGTLLVEELGAAYFAVPALARGAEVLLKVSASFAGQARLDCREMAARLLRRLGDRRSVQLLEEVRRGSALPGQRDRAAWFLLDLASERGGFLEELERQEPASGWQVPGYFSDILDREITRLTARRAWDRLLRLRELLPPGRPAAVQARLAFILARAAALGLVAGSAVEEEALLAASRALDAGGYYGLLAEGRLGEGRGGGWLSGGPAPGGDAGRPEAQEEAVVVRGLLSYGLYEPAVQRVLRVREQLPASFVLEVSSALRDRQRYADSVRLAAAVAAEGSGQEALRLVYPRAYAAEIEAAAAQEDLDPGLFFALVREESLFDPLAVSGSGAVGLTQLMPEAAADAARRLRLPSYDLRDPIQNLRLGARHLRRLAARLEDVPKTLMAYNAGLSRLRAWERSYSGLPPELLLEALPFPETQGYVRKILVSAVRYDTLYFGRSVAQTVTGFFPLLTQGKESPR